MGAQEDFESYIEEKAIARYREATGDSYVSTDFRNGVEYAATLAAEMIKSYFRVEESKQTTDDADDCYCELLDEDGD